MDSLEDRFAEATYSSDEPVSVTGGGKLHEVPERLFVRAQRIAAAYELALLPAINVYGRTELVPAQAARLAHELAFVRRVTADRLLAPHLVALETIADDCWRTTTQQVLTVEGP